MFHPIGSLPPQIYWRRRIMLAGAVAAIALVVITIIALSGNSKAENTASTTSSSSHSSGPAPSHSSSSDSTTASSGSSSSSGSSGAPDSAAGSSAASGASASQPALVACPAAQLTVTAASQAPNYQVGDQPVLILQVTNNGPGNCTQDLADSQVELRVYNGAARVWGSHDCVVQPGTAVRTLVAGTTIGVQITWSGLSSQPGCAGTRQRVGAGTYTLYPFLAGAQGTVAQFALS
jgi:hypothetical protein